MPTPAKILLAGTIAATGLCLAGTSSAQSSSALNEQIQLGDVFSSQTLNSLSVATSTANSFDARGDRGDLDVVSYQELGANVTAEAQVNAAVSTGAVTTVAANASGNVGDAAIFGGALTAVSTQVSGTGRISSLTHIEAPGADGGDVASSSQALGNSQGWSVRAAVAGTRTTQNNGAEILADGGGVYGLITGTASFSAAASGNNITSAAGYGSSERMIADQNNEGPLVQASQFTAFGNAAVAHTSATAAANNISAGNEGALLDVASLQQNQAYVRAQAESSAFLFGGATATAYGVGNSLLAGQLGQEVVIDAEQLNLGGGVDAIAAISGHDGYDASASAMAMGNAATGYACADCDGAMYVNNRQTNATGVSATGSVTVTGSARSAVGSAHAVGNTASYYVSRPGE
jgi:hypothetical protein